MQFSLHIDKLQIQWSRAILFIAVVSLLLSCNFLSAEPAYRTVLQQQSETLDFPADKPLYRLHPLLLSYRGAQFDNTSHDTFVNLAIATILSGSWSAGDEYDNAPFKSFVIVGSKIPLWLKNCSKLL
jgi:hypothetical protein